MQYPGTVDNWIDQSGIQAIPVENTGNAPLILAAAAFDRGPEKITKIRGTDFYKLYGYYIDFAKYGQAAIQAANVINNGGELLLKRVVADDATLANIVLVAHVTTNRIQKTDENGELLWTDPTTDEETTEQVDNAEAAMINVATISHELVSITGKKTKAQIFEEARRLYKEDDESKGFTYPLFMIADNGRGESTKRFGVSPQYAISKNNNFMIYRLHYLGSEDLDAEQVYFVLKPGVMYLQKSMDLEMTAADMMQATAKPFEESIEAFYDKISEISGIEINELYKYDVLFGRSNKGDLVRGLAIGDDSQDIGVGMGFPLMSGTNGAFGKCPIDTDEYETALGEFFDGTFDSDIFNLDMYKPDVCIDANYPYSVKQKIVKLADFRKDFFFLGDLGLDVNTLDNAITKYYDMPKSRFAAWYAQSYEIINPFSKRKVAVTMNYDIAGVIVKHLNTSKHTPYCGIQFGFTFPNAVEGTINFTPKITPAMNQKQLLDDLRLNYASILNDVLTIETEYTSQEDLTQLSFINNVIAIQAIIKDVRDNCPAFRYSFISSDDLSTYKTEVENIISKYAGWFESLEFVYVQDDIMAANKIFEASIKIKHQDFVQSEILNIYTLGTEQATIASSDTSAYSTSGIYEG